MPEPPEDAAERMRLWLSNVDEARRHVDKLNRAKHRIVELALQVCDIQHGGGSHWSKFDGTFTLRRFAKETGIHYRTLWGWIDVRRRIIGALAPGDYKEEDYRYAVRVAKTCGVNASRKEIRDEFRRNRDSKTGVYRIGMIIQWTKSHRNFVLRSDLSKFKRAELEALMAVSEDMARGIREHLATANTADLGSQG